MRVRAAVCAATVLALAGCGLGPPADLGYVTVDDVLARADASPDATDVESVQALFDELPGDEPFTWRGGSAVYSPASDAQTWAVAPSRPAGCEVFYQGLELHFKADIDRDTEDTILEATLADYAGPGWDDDTHVATVLVRVMTEPQRGVTEMVQPLTRAAAWCGEGYTVFDEEYDNQWDRASAVELIDLPGVDASLPAVGYLLDGDSPYIEAPQQVRAWVVVDNLLVHVKYDVDPDRPWASLEDAQAFIAECVEVFSGAA